MTMNFFVNKMLVIVDLDMQYYKMKEAHTKERKDAEKEFIDQSSSASTALESSSCCKIKEVNPNLFQDKYDKLFPNSIDHLFKLIKEGIYKYSKRVCSVL